MRPNQIGLQFGRLKIVSMDPSGGRAKAVCACACGVEARVRIEHLKSGHTRSCGCMQREAAAVTGRSRDQILTERFWRKVDKSGPAPAHVPEIGNCWTWIGGGIRDKGYGIFWLRGQMVRPHRVSWLIAHGEMPTLCVLHRCDNRACVRPDHLREGTQLENIADRVAKGRSHRPSLDINKPKKHRLARPEAATLSPASNP